MMSRGIAAPLLSRRYPVSIGCWIKVLTSMMSPRLARCGKLINTRAIGSSLLRAGGQGHDDVGTVRAEAAIGEAGDRDKALRVGKADAGGDISLAGPRTEIECRNIGLRVFLVEDVDALDVVGLRHRALDRHGQRYSIAVLDDRRQFELDLSGLQRSFADQLTDRLCHRPLRRTGRGRERGEPGSGRRRQDPAASQQMLPTTHGLWGISITRAESQERYHILDLLGGQDRLAAPRVTDPGETLYPVIWRHDGVGVEARGIDQAQSQLTFGPARTRPGQIRRQRSEGVV